LNVIEVAAGLILLTLAADRFVVAAARLARAWGISPVLIGALILGMGTSAPELLVGTLAAAQGELDVAIGAVIGSNVANVSLVLGTAAAVWPIAGAQRTIRREGILMLFAVIALAATLWDGALSRLEGAVLLAAMFLVAWLLVRWRTMRLSSALKSAAMARPWPRRASTRVASTTSFAASPNTAWTERATPAVRRPAASIARATSVRRCPGAVPAQSTSSTPTAARTAATWPPPTPVPPATVPTPVSALAS
jgi:Ca2+/Na+ antiporter